MASHVHIFPICLYSLVKSPSKVFLIVSRTPHVSVDSRREGRERRTAAAYGHGPAASRQDAARQTAGSDAVGEVVLGPQALDAALNTREQRADLAKVLGHAVGSRAHVLEARGQLLPQRQGGDIFRGGARRAGDVVRGVVRHL
jgi:hypothetical protein